MTRVQTVHFAEPRTHRTHRTLRADHRSHPRVRRREGLGLAALLALCPLAQGCGAPESLRPNLVLITIDTLRTDRLACYGGPDAGGTALCDLADSGTRYVWAISPSPSTRIAIASLFTSRYPSQHGVSAESWSALPSRAVTLAETLRAGGYATGAFVGNPGLNRSSNLQQGFDIFDDRQLSAPATPLRGGAEAVGRPAASLTRAALGFAQRVAEPWFIWIHYGETRGPRAPPKLGHSGPPDRLRGYDAEIRLIDHQIGGLIGGLDALGRPGVAITADHGQALGDDGFRHEDGHSVGLDQIRVPLVWRPPHELDAGRASHRGRVHSEPVSTLDLAATLLAAARLEAPESFAGVPLGSRGTAADASPARQIFAEHRQQAAVVTNGFYYARDQRTRRTLGEPLRDPVGEPVRDDRRQPLPPRFARLNDDGTRTPYRLYRLYRPHEPYPLNDSYGPSRASNSVGGGVEVSSEVGAKLDALEATLSEFLAAHGSATDEMRE